MLQVKKGKVEEEEEEESDEDEEDESEDEEEDSDDDEDDDDLSPEDMYEQLIRKHIKEKGGSASLSSLGNIPKPEGIPKQTKLKQFLSTRKSFSVNGGIVSLDQDKEIYHQLSTPDHGEQ